MYLLCLMGALLVILVSSETTESNDMIEDLEKRIVNSLRNMLHQDKEVYGNRRILSTVIQFTGKETINSSSTSNQNNEKIASNESVASKDLSRITNPTFTPAANHSSGSQFYDHSSQLWNETMENATRDNVEIAQILFDLDDEIISQREQSRRMGLNFYLAAKKIESAVKNCARKNQIINQTQNSKLAPLKQIKRNRNKASATLKIADHGISEVHEKIGSDNTRDDIFDMAQRNIKNAVKTLRKYFPLVADQLEGQFKDMAVNNYEYEQYTYRLGVQKTADAVINSFM